MTGIDSIPSLDSAGNVLRPHTAVKLSLRLRQPSMATRPARC